MSHSTFTENPGPSPSEQAKGYSGREKLPQSKRKKAREKPGLRRGPLAFRSAQDNQTSTTSLTG